MDMQAKHQDQRVFHLTGKRQGEGLSAIDGLDLRPALLAQFKDAFLPVALGIEPGEGNWKRRILPASGQPR